MMTEKIKITQGDGTVTEIAAIDILGTSYVQKEPTGDSYYFLVFKQGGREKWKISGFSSKEDAMAELDSVDDEYYRIMSQ